MDGNPKKVLVVEDNEFNAKMLVDKLNASGFVGISAEDGEKGLAAALKEKPDLIILDILMPVMDGIEVLQKLREDPWGKDVKVVVITNLTRDDKLGEAYKYGVSDYLVKANWDMDDVIEKVKSTLESQ